MANGNPKFGGTNGVPTLDIGQPGGTRATAGDALATISVTLEPEQVRSTTHELGEQNAVYTDVMGFGGSRVVWNVTLRTKDNATYLAVIRELNACKHGSVRSAQTGVMGAPDPSRIKETQLTDHDGTILSPKARLADWHPRRRRSRSEPDWAVLQKLDLVFELNG
jgi:hypothetical protein